MTMDAQVASAGFGCGLAADSHLSNLFAGVVCGLGSFTVQNKDVRQSLEGHPDAASQAYSGERKNVARLA